VPDIYHSYLGLAALSIMKEPGLKPLCSALCVSVEQKQKIEKLRNSASVPTRLYWRNGYSFSIREDDPDFETKMGASKQPPADPTNPAPK
jgi:geranylgeranyl transferase type-1 subunit beta